MTPLKQSDSVRDHHYLPRFYLAKWALNDRDELWQYGLNPVGRFAERSVAARRVAKSEFLYSVKDDVSYMPQQRPAQIETDFLSPLDDEGPTQAH
jgi:hypothetical protein